MDDALFEALMIGVNTFIFIMAMTAGMILMGKINDMVEYTKMEVVSDSNGALSEIEGEVPERTYTGTQVYSLYGQHKRNELASDISIKVKVSNHVYNISNYGSAGLSYLDDTFSLEMKNENDFTFVLQDI